MEKELIRGEELNLVSGGVLLEGWENTLLMIMKIYKKAHGEEGLQKVKDLMVISLNDPTSPIEEEDTETVYGFIEGNWNSIPIE